MFDPARQRVRVSTRFPSSAGDSVPTIDSVIGIDDIVDGHRRMQNNQAVGKIVVLAAAEMAALEGTISVIDHA
jgi:hypothetical protein